MKRIVRIAAAVLFAASLCLFLLSCSGKTDDKGLVYTLDKETDTYTVTGYTGSAKELEIPAKYDSKLVAAIGASAFNGNKSITKVTIPSSVKTIGATAFYGCTELTEVIFSEGSEISEIPTGAFSGCSKLDGVVIPDTVKKIGYKAFNNCTSMKTVTFPDKLETIDFYAFSGCSTLEDVVFDETKSFKVYPNAFSGCNDLTTLMTPAVTAEEAKSAVYTYSNGMLTEENDKGMKLIKWLKSDGTTCEIGANVYEIHPQAFTDRDDIEGFTVAEGNKNYSAENGILYNSDKTKLIAYPIGKADTELAVADSVKEIAPYAFYGNKTLEKVTLGASVSAIGEAAFGNSYLKTLITGESKISVGKNAFNAKSLESYGNIEKDLEYVIEGRVLFSANGETLVSYPKELENESYEISAAVKTVSDGAFALNASLSSITVKAENTMLVAKDGVLFVRDKDNNLEKLVAYPRAKAGAEYTVPATVKEIGAYAFSGCANLEKVTLNDKCAALENGLFSGCESLKTLVILAKELNVKENALENCEALKEIFFAGNDNAKKDACENATKYDKDILDAATWTVNYKPAA